jgi:nucleotide-binding universal stress UspA family protein
VSSTIIAGYDGSDAARAAVRFAARLGQALSADVVAVSGYPVPPHVFGKGASDGAEAALAADSRADADLTLSKLDEEGILSRLVRAGEPARALVEAAEELEAGLIAVGTHHAAGLGRLSPSSTGGRLVHGAPCSVAIVPADGAGDDLKAVAVAYDAGESARTALGFASRLARSLSARLVLISVIDPLAGTRFETSEEEDRRHRSAMAREAEQAAEELAPELEVEVRTVTGVPGEAVVAACKDADLLVAGSRGYGPLRAVLAGSVSRYLADHAPCPLIVVPRQVHAPWDAPAVV